MKKIVCALFYISLLHQQLPAQIREGKAFTVKGFLPFHKGSTIRLLVDGRPVDTIILRQDMYSFNGKTDQPLPATLEIKKEKAVQFLSFFIEPGTIKIIDGGKLSLLATGTTLNDTYTKLAREMDEMASFQASLQAVGSYRRTLAARYISENPASLISLRLLYDLFYLQNAMDDTTYYPLFQSLSPAIRNTDAGKKIAAEAAVSHNTALGNTAPLLYLPDVAQQITPLYNDKEFTLVDFWASWCVPCRKENPGLLAVFDKYSAHGFSITSVSLDLNRAAWKQAIARDGMVWTQLNDFKSWNGAAVQQYGIKTIPTNFLLDRKGNIIAKNLSPQTLDRKLQELLLTR